MHLYETHLPVQDTERSAQFYREIVGLELAYRDRDRDIVFLWIGENRRSMLGLWGPGTPLGQLPGKHHLAIALTVAELLEAGQRLNRLQVTTRNFLRESTTEPSVIGWMPAAQLYFTDPDGHSLEYIALLDDPPEPNFVGSLSSWRQRTE